jgi:hypothetical protein
MGLGLEAVKNEINRSFEAVEIGEWFDPDLRSTCIRFLAGEREFSVTVSEEFDADYASGQMPVDLSKLAPLLGASQLGKVAVDSLGISFRLRRSGEDCSRN